MVTTQLLHVHYGAKLCQQRLTVEMFGLSTKNAPRKRTGHTKQLTDCFQYSEMSLQMVITVHKQGIYWNDFRVVLIFQSRSEGSGLLLTSQAVVRTLTFTVVLIVSLNTCNDTYVSEAF